jgi:hypothetical protein
LEKLNYLNTGSLVNGLKCWRQAHGAIMSFGARGIINVDCRLLMSTISDILVAMLGIQLNVAFGYKIAPSNNTVKSPEVLVRPSV